MLSITLTPTLTQNSPTSLNLNRSIAINPIDTTRISTVLIAIACP